MLAYTSLQPLPLKVFTQRNFVADVIPLKLNFLLKNKKMLFEPPFGDLGATYALHLVLVGKPMSTSYFIFPIPIEVFSLSLTIEKLEAEIFCQVGVYTTSFILTDTSSGNFFEPC